VFSHGSKPNELQPPNWPRRWQASSKRLTQPPIQGVNICFLDSLVKGEIENFGNQFQDGLPFGSRS